jgi:hypothetical protein
MTAHHNADPRSMHEAGMLMTTSTAVRGALDVMARELGGPIVEMVVDGRQLFAAFEVDPIEHGRRLELGVGAVTSTGLLHGLWLLPAGGCVPACALPEVKRARLRNAPHAVVERDSGFERTYAPPGVVRGVGFDGSNSAATVARAARFTPIVRRIALVHASRGISGSAERSAREFGVGVVLVDDESARVAVPAVGPVPGVPSVYRWWIAELAYERMLYETTQPVS